jgi:hypothetical protein
MPKEAWCAVSTLAQSRDQCARPWDLAFIIRRAWGMATIAHRFERRVDLTKRGLGNGGVLAALRDAR